MDWIPALTTTTLLGAALWLARNWIATRLTNAVRHEYDTKIEQLRAELRAKETQIEALRTGALSGLANRQAAIFERRLAAIEQLWNSVVSLGPAKGVAAWMAAVKFDAAAKKAAKNPQFREIFTVVGNMPIRLPPKAWFWPMVTTGSVLGIAVRCENFHQRKALRGDVGAPWSVTRVTRPRIHHLGS